MKVNKFISIFSVVLCLFAFTAVSYAWFTLDNESDLSGIDGTIKVSPNLVISKDPDEIKNYTINTVDYNVIVFENDIIDMIPCTHDNNYNHYLKYVINNYDINSNGLPNQGTELEFDNVENNQKYFFDVTVYIASIEQKFDNYHLDAFIKLPIVDENTLDIHKAISVDFYTEEVNTNNYKGTLNLASLDNEINDGSTKKEQVRILNNDIPLNIEGSRKIIMRYYFDGALLKSNSSTFISSETINNIACSITIAFKVEKNN